MLLTYFTFVFALRGVDPGATSPASSFLLVGKPGLGTGSTGKLAVLPGPLGWGGHRLALGRTSPAVQGHVPGLHHFFFFLKETQLLKETCLKMSLPCPPDPELWLSPWSDLLAPERPLTLVPLSACPSRSLGFCEATGSAWARPAPHGQGDGEWTDPRVPAAGPGSLSPVAAPHVPSPGPWRVAWPRLGRRVTTVPSWPGCHGDVAAVGA